jgi:hypothetical protein
VDVTAGTTERGLSTSELEQIGTQLAAGRKPRVVFTEAAGQIAGQQGQVVELTDPALSDEWVVVRFGRDELPFSPADLAVAPKGPRKAVKTVAVRPPAEPEVTGPPLLPAPSSVPLPRKEAAVPRTSPPATDTAADKPDSTGAASTGSGGSAAGGSGDAAAGPPAGRTGKAGGRKAAKPKAPAALTVTLAYADGEWTVAAQQGAKHLARPYLIKAAEALKMVGMLDVPGVHEAVEEIVSAARAQAEAEAERLRQELAEVEERLAELRGTG